MLNTRRRGFVLPFVLILGAMLSIAALSFFRKMESASQVTADTVGRKRAFYAADGLGRAIVRRAASYTSSVASPDVTGLRAAVSTTFVDSILPPGFARDGAFTLNYLGGSAPGPLPSGPFAGMNAKQQNVEFSLKIRDNVTKAAGFTNQTVSLAQVSMFQFFIFSDHPLQGTPTAGNGTWMGRIHGNGDVCLGSNATMNFEFVTASGRILNHSRSGGTECLLAGSGGTANIRNAANTGWTALTSGNDHIGSGAGWLAAVSANWGSHAQDSSHDVPVLKVPVIGTPVTQSGRDMAGTVKSNASASRFLVDPPRVDNSAVVQDSADILAQKFACKADIRIINGIWFLKPNNPTDDCGWPGTPIWSDHPGNYTTAAGLNTVSGGIEGDALPVGQAQVHPATPRATKYSYYETDAAHEVVGNADGVISYGPVMHNGAKHVPAFTYLQNSGQSCGTPAAPCLCQRDSNNTAYGASGTVRLGNATFDYVTTPTAGQGCKRFGGATLTPAEQLIHGTRSGFNDPRVAKGETAAKGRVLPINVDVAGLAAALADSTGGELGAKFAGLGRTFNGVVYVTSGWVNAQTEYGTGNLAPLWPDQGGLTDTNQTNHYAGYGGNLTNNAIPYPLCSGNRNHTQDLTNGGVFRHHNCGAATAMGTPNAVRIINGANMVAAAFPKGLTIASNLPVYILGNYNTTSDESNATATPWIPALVAGDAVTFLSNSWSDVEEDLPWSATPGTFAGRAASDTEYNTCVLAGWVGPTGAHNGGLHNFPRFLETWSGDTARINGSLVNAFYSVYARQNFDHPGGGCWVYTPPTRDWGFDPHLNSITNQPPGAPVFTVSATKRWARE